MEKGVRVRSRRSDPEGPPPAERVPVPAPNGAVATNLETTRRKRSSDVRELGRVHDRDHRVPIVEEVANVPSVGVVERERDPGGRGSVRRGRRAICGASVGPRIGGESLCAHIGRGKG